jgi:hypothetical protein
MTNVKLTVLPRLGRILPALSFAVLTSFCASIAFCAEKAVCTKFTDAQVEQLNLDLKAFDEGHLDAPSLTKKYERKAQLRFIMYVMLFGSEMKRDKVDEAFGLGIIPLTQVPAVFPSK